MKKHALYWLPVIKKNVRGENYANESPDIIARCYRGALLERILNMPEGNPISFETAVDLAYEASTRAFDAGRIGNAEGECHWYDHHFVEWISSLNLQINLTGDEFELWQGPEKEI